MTMQEAHNIINEIVYKNFYFKIKHDIMDDFIRIKATAPVRDACSGYNYEVAPVIPITTVQVLDFRFFERMNKDDFICIIYQTCRRLEMHELDEHFKVNNICFKDPHPEIKKHA